MNNYEEIYLYD